MGLSLEPVVPVDELVSLEPLFSVLFARLGSFAGRSWPHATTAKLIVEITTAACSRTIFYFS
jgi:hypothetical protein